MPGNEFDGWKQAAHTIVNAPDALAGWVRDIRQTFARLLPTFNKYQLGKITSAKDMQFEADKLKQHIVTNILPIFADLEKAVAAKADMTALPPEDLEKFAKLKTELIVVIKALNKILETVNLINKTAKQFELINLTEFNNLSFKTPDALKNVEQKLQTAVKTLQQISDAAKKQIVDVKAGTDSASKVLRIKFKEGSK